MIGQLGEREQERARNMAYESRVPRVARGCQPQDNNFIIEGITPTRRGTVSVLGVGGYANIVSAMQVDSEISDLSVSLGTKSLGEI